MFLSTSVGCIETEDIIADPHDLVVERCPGFLETDLGKWEGKTKEEMKSQYPKLYEWFFIKVSPNSSDMQITPGGETRNQARDRSLSKLNQIVDACVDSNILIVSHSHAIKIIICSLLGLDYSNIWKINQPNYALNLFEYDGKNVLFYIIQDTSHLERTDIFSRSIQRESAGLFILGKAKRKTKE